MWARHAHLPPRAHSRDVAVPCHGGCGTSASSLRAPCFFDPPPPPQLRPSVLPSMSRLDYIRFRRRHHPASCPLSSCPIPWNPDSAPTCRPPARLAFTSPLSLSCGRGWWVGAFLVIESKKKKNQELSSVAGGVLSVPFLACVRDRELQNSSRLFLGSRGHVEGHRREGWLLVI